MRIEIRVIRDLSNETVEGSFEGSVPAWIGRNLEDWLRYHKVPLPSFQFQARPLNDIAREIRADWRKPYFGAVPYLDAMGSLSSVHEHYGADSAKSIVLYFLGNAHTWRGATARRVKKELRELVK